MLSAIKHIKLNIKIAKYEKKIIIIIINIPNVRIEIFIFSHNLICLLLLYVNSILCNFCIEGNTS